MTNKDIDVYTADKYTIGSTACMELETICKALRKTKGKRNNAAYELGISTRTIQRKIIQHSIPKGYGKEN